MISPELRAACEQLAGVAFGGLYCAGFPVILHWTEWPKWQKMLPSTSDESSVDPPPELQSTDDKLWALQSNYFSVVTLLRAPGHLVHVQLAKGDTVRVLGRMTLHDWLAAEIERDTPSQNPGFVG